MRVRVGAYPVVWATRGGLGGWPTRLVGTVCKNHVQYPAFAQPTPAVAVGFWSFSHHIVDHLFQLHMHIQFFGPTIAFFFCCLWEIFVRCTHWQQESLVSSLPQLYHFEPCFSHTKYYGNHITYHSKYMYKIRPHERYFVNVTFLFIAISVSNLPMNDPLNRWNLNICCVRTLPET